jgi:hypothetical protein
MVKIFIDLAKTYDTVALLPRFNECKARPKLVNHHFSLVPYGGIMLGVVIFLPDVPKYTF